jgi:hypothetical protein
MFYRTKFILLPLTMAYVQTTPKLIFGSFNSHCWLNRIIIPLYILTKPSFSYLDITDGDFDD